MKTRRYSEAQVFRILQEVDAGSQVVDVTPGLQQATAVRFDEAFSTKYNEPRNKPVGKSR